MKTILHYFYRKLPLTFQEQLMSYLLFWLIQSFLPALINPTALPKNSCIINPGITVTVLFGSEWLIGAQTSLEQIAASAVLAEPGSDLFFDSIHDHSLTEWRDSWESTHQDTDKLPEVFIPLTNRT
jgi:hypothetical protein